MSGNSNFVQFNPPANNCLTDTAYATDSVRENGYTPSALVPHGDINKEAYQSSTFVASLALALANKSFNVLDGSPSQTPNLVTPSTAVTTLAAVLANILTTADYAEIITAVTAGFVFNASNLSFYLRLPNCLGNFVIQGYGLTSSSHPYAVTFPVAFTEIPVVVAVADDTTVGISQSSVTTTGFTAQIAGGTFFMYIAIGK